ncbi:hypothetical protein KUTeg_004546 [Tegillarca granosa]|uniref:Chitobiosyldiphosphodolichol beta-mannosyltransferase n=1 Tax=Tegillarca granosa TaxID=220873 RepID=A0ABQ9FUQ6_TEGGR|nr:hypothetical protein KUTeg_004546 [Tegillarca granosa]
MNMLFIGPFFYVFPLVLVMLYIALNYFVQGRKYVCVVVLGDIGRSPRMQYHSLSLAKEQYNVDLIGYGGSKCHRDVTYNPKIHIRQIAEPPVFVNYMPRLLAYILKVIWQTVTLGMTLLLIPKCGYVLIQNPPCIPTIAIAWFSCLLRGSKLIIDWHNYGYTILGLTLGQQNKLVRFSKWYEGFFGKFSSANICVTKAMKEDLKSNWNINAVTMYDRPPEIFKEADIQQKHKLFLELSKEYPVFLQSNEVQSTTFTVKTGDNEVKLKTDRPLLLVSSTSWTEDEDFGILLTALEGYEEKSSTDNSFPDILCVITGSADLGVCLHKSSSGLDLPMKVVDMFGCGLPVCAIHYNCLSELVQDKTNGCIFRDSNELTSLLQVCTYQDFQDTLLDL